MTSSKLLKEITANRNCGEVYLTVYKKPADSDWESSILQRLPIIGISTEDFKASLIKISTHELARGILAELLHHDLAYGVGIMSLEKAHSLADAFISLFSDQAAYFSNSTWNKNEYCGADKKFELGQTAWTSLTKATFDSGLIICDADRIGIAWFADED